EISGHRLEALCSRRGYSGPRNSGRWPSKPFLSSIGVREMSFIGPASIFPEAVVATSPAPLPVPLAAALVGAALGFVAGRVAFGPRVPTALLLRQAEIASLQRDSESALAWLRMLARRRPRDADLHFERGW